MKTARLLSIVTYLLNHDIVSAAKLADRFEVSKRTILRDIEQISMAGIPIQSLPGMNGGYSIMEGYKLNGQVISVEDQASIISALKGYISAYDNKHYNEVLEKMASILPKHQSQHVFLDFGASGENSEIQNKLHTLDRAIQNKDTVHISYVNALGEVSNRIVEPVALSYRWYAWYLLAFCTTKQDYRVFKLARISELIPAGIVFSKEHGDPLGLLEQAFQGSGRKSYMITLLCKAEARVQICEYLDGTITEIFDNGDFIMCMNSLSDERMWYATLLSFGDKVTVLEPAEVRTRLTETAENILSHYRKQ